MTDIVKGKLPDGEYWLERVLEPVSPPDVIVLRVREQAPKQPPKMKRPRPLMKRQQHKP